MTLSNSWFLAALLGVLLVFHLEWLAALLNSARIGKALPPLLADLYTDEKREQLREYFLDKQRVGLTQSFTSLALLVGVWWIGGFGWLQSACASLGHGPVLTGLIVIAAVVLALTLAGLPFEIWHTFGVEQKHGFNKTTPRTFVSDQLKGLLLTALVGLPATALVLWFFETQTLAALYAWLFLAAFSLLMTWLSPRLIMPLFLKFRPLEEGALRAGILALAEKLRFPVGEVSIVDGSRRSTKANAFFAGFGKTRRIALFDTLLENHTQEEILAVLAHEIGHSRLRHVPKHLALALAEMGVIFALLGWALRSPDFFAAFGVAGTPVGMGLVLFGLIYKPLGLLIGIGGLALSRRHEFEADAFAARAVGGPEPLLSGLKKLATDHLAHPQPHPLAVCLHHSHPPLARRLEALQRG